MPITEDQSRAGYNLRSIDCAIALHFTLSKDPQGRYSLFHRYGSNSPAEVPSPNPGGETHPAHQLSPSDLGKAVASMFRALPVEHSREETIGGSGIFIQCDQTTCADPVAFAIDPLIKELNEKYRTTCQLVLHIHRSSYIRR